MTIIQDILGGWATFVFSLGAMGILVAIIGDLASHIGCFTYIKENVTAVTLLALGTSVPGY